MADNLRCKLSPLGRTISAILIIIAACALMGSSCHKKRENKKLQDYSEELNEIVTDFNKLIVWRGYSTASMMVVPSKRLDFLMEAEQFGPNLTIEDYAVVMCQVSKDPPVRDLGLPESTDALSVNEDKPAALPYPDEAKPEHSDASTEKAEGEAEKEDAADNEKEKETKKKKSKEPEMYYGTALVRFINRTILPSMYVDTKLIKQYWINVEGTWYCDFSWQDMLKR